MKEYIINYRVKGNKEGAIYETSLTANNLKEARISAKNDLQEEYTIVSIKLA